ncbi:MAG: hypothetical protein NZ580_05535 [Bacteroidia bacterium]|nr:hypothetical protein [Bacteroidia bacterium]MDW8236338.1 proton-conducting transporter membrane subunit [Bacteroidia bacterium]
MESLLSLTIGGLLALILGTIRSLRASVPWVSGASGAIAVALGIYTALQLPVPRSSFWNMLWGGGIYSLLAAGISLVLLIAIPFLANHPLYRSERQGWEVFPLTLLIGTALISLAASNHFLLSVVAVETAALGSYVLISFIGGNKLAVEASIKYFLMGALGFALLLMGFSYLYGITGTLYIHHLRPMKWEGWQDSSSFALAVGLIGMGIFFKLAVFPFHWGAPDAYGGAIPSAAGLVAATAKLSAAFLAGQVLYAVQIPPSWLSAAALLAAFSALYGNLAALSQKQLQRMLGYSSVAHGSYMLLALCAGAEGILASWAYALVYGLMSVLAFGLIGLQENPLEEKELRGLGYRQPGYAVALAVALVALAGIPPLAGFFAKYALFVSAFRAGFTLPAVVSLLSALVGYYYYWRPVGWLFQLGSGAASTRPILAIGAFLLVIVGILPTLVWGWMDYLYGLAGLFQSRP